MNANLIRDEFAHAMKLARSYFPNSKLSWSVESDPDYDGRWIELDITDSANPDDALSRYDSLVSEWTAKTDSRVDSLIRFTINLS